MTTLKSLAPPILALFLAPALAGSPSDTPSAELQGLFDEYLDWQLREFPEMAMARGDYSHADRITDPSLEAIHDRLDVTAAFLDRLRSVDVSRLDDQDRVSYDLFERQLWQAIEENRHRTFLAPFGVLSGPLQEIPQMAERIRFQSETDYENYITRLGLVPKSIDAYIERMKLGVAEGRTPPRVTLEGAPAQFNALLEGGGLRALADPFDRFPDSIPQGRREELTESFEEVYANVESAMRTFGEYVRTEYLPGCRESIAATDWPDGEAFYNYRLQVMTTTDLTARQIHEIGLKEVARIRAEMLEVIRRTDFTELHPETSSLDDDELFRRFIHYLRTDPRFYYDTPEALLAGYRDICKRVDAELPRFFHVLPRLTYGVRAIPSYMAPYSTTAYYSQGDIRNGEPGYFYANTYGLDQRPKYEMIALAVHEAVPGHHFQVAIAQELEGLPEFRKNSWVTAFGEGWALYTEHLGIEMGLYEDPYDDFGRLTYEMWRACRLVVDPGMHALGWSRERAIRFMLDNSALTKLNIENEVDRYISWPGQATGYKIGELKIRELRARAEHALGDRFDLRAFHDRLLSAGSLPLNVLERRVDEWIAEQKQEVPGVPVGYD